MKGRQKSVSRLPEISAKKKQKIIKTSSKFQEQIEAVQKKQRQNQAKLDVLEGLGFGLSPKKSHSLQKFIQTYNEYEQQALGQPNQTWKFSQQIHPNKLKSNTKISVQKRKSEILERGSGQKESQNKSRSGSKKLKGEQKFNDEQILKHKLFTQKLTLKPISKIADSMQNYLQKQQNRKKSAMMAFTERQKPTVPFYSTSQKKVIEYPFVKVSEDVSQNKVKVRLANGVIKQMNKKCLVYKMGEEESIDTIEKIGCQVGEQNSQKWITIDESFLHKILERINKNKIKQISITNSRKQQLMADLKQNYKNSMKLLTKQKQPKRSQVKTYFPSQNLSKVVKEKMQKKLICSQELQFLSIFNLQKSKYINDLVGCHNVIRKMQNFFHFDILEMIIIYDEDCQHIVVPQITKSLSIINSIQNKGTVTNMNLKQHLQTKAGQIELLIYQLQQEIQTFSFKIQKDIEYIVNMNPRLATVPFQQYMRTFIMKWIIVRSTLSSQIKKQLQQISSYFHSLIDLPFSNFLNPKHPNTLFYQSINKINRPIQTPFSQVLISQGATLLVLKLKMRKLKRKVITNIYRFLIGSRKMIRIYPQKNLQKANDSQRKEQSVKSHFPSKHNEILQLGIKKQRIHFNQSLKILKQSIVDPIKKYVEHDISKSQNVNGCINNTSLNLHIDGCIDRFEESVVQLNNKIETKILQKYEEYFSYWQLYLLEKPYIQEITSLIKRTNGIKLMEQEMDCLKSDLSIIQNFPNLITDQIVVIDITEVKAKIISTIEWSMNKILKTSEEVLQKILTLGQVEAQKAKQLNKVVPYTTIAEYIDFAKTLSDRAVEKSIDRVSMNTFAILKNWAFLEENNYKIKSKVMEQYLESSIWVPVLRKAVSQNKQKLFVNPNIFMEGLADRKCLIYFKYMFLVKEIVEIIKISQISHWGRLSTNAKTIYKQLQQITSLAKQIETQQNLLRLPYQTDSQLAIAKSGEEKVMKQKPKEGGIYKQDLTFFYKQKIYFLKFVQFWEYVAKFKDQIEEISRLTLYEINGQNIVKVIREGQQTLAELKTTVVNKRLLGLLQKMYKYIDPYIKNSKLIKVLCNGSESARVRSIMELKAQIDGYLKKIDEGKQKMMNKVLSQENDGADLNEKEGHLITAIVAQDSSEMMSNLNDKETNLKKESQQINKDIQPAQARDVEMAVKSIQKQQKEAQIDGLKQFMKTDEFQITLANVIEINLPVINLTPFYQMYEQQRKKEETILKIKKVINYIKSMEVKTKQISVCSPVPPIDILVVPQLAINFISKQALQINQIYTQTTKRMSSLPQNLLIIVNEYYQSLQTCFNKLTIFSKSLCKLKRVQPFIQRAYSWFQIILPCIGPIKAKIQAFYRPVYDQFLLEYTKKLEVLQKLEYFHLYQDRIRQNYDEEIYKFQELAVKVWNHEGFGMKALRKMYPHLRGEHHLFEYLNRLPSVLIDQNDSSSSKNSKGNKRPPDSNQNSVLPDLSYLFTQGLKNLTFTVKYSQRQSCFMLRAHKIQTIHKETIVFENVSKSNEANFNPKHRLFSVEKQQSQQSNIDPVYKCGILQLIYSIQNCLPQILKTQTIQILPLVYQLHYNIKQIYSLYMAFQNCVFQSIINSLSCIFYMDLLLVWQNENDIKVLLKKIKECSLCLYEPKESDNRLFVSQIFCLLELFIGIIQVVIKRKNYVSSEFEKEKEKENIHKKLVLELIPTIVIKQYLGENNRKIMKDWLLVAKRKSEDQWINQTHLNPVLWKILQSKGLSHNLYKQVLDKIEQRDVETKPLIPFSNLSKSILSFLLGETQKQTSNPINAHLFQSVQFSIGSIGSQTNPFGFQIIQTTKFWRHEIEKRINTTWLLLEANSKGKVLVTNTHPFSNLLGLNIRHLLIKTTPNPSFISGPDTYLHTLNAYREKKYQQQHPEQLNPLKNNNLYTSSHRSQSLRVTSTKNKQFLRSTNQQISFNFGARNNQHVENDVYDMGQNGQNLENYLNQLMGEAVADNGQCIGIIVGESQDLQWVLSYLGQSKERKNKSKQNKSDNIIYVYCLNPEHYQAIKNHPKISHCNTYFSQQNIQDQATVSNSSLFQKTSNSHHSSLLFKKFTTQQPFSPFQTPPHPQIILSHPILKHPLPQKQKQHIQKCIEQVYGELSIKQFLNMEQMAPTIYALHFGAFILPAGKIESNMEAEYIMQIIGRSLRKIHTTITTPNKLNTTNLFTIPIYSLTPTSLLGSIRSVPSRSYSSSVSNCESYFENNFGILELMLTIPNLVDHQQIQRLICCPILNQFYVCDQRTDKLKEKDANVSNWFILDLSVVNNNSRYIYNWLINGFRTSKWSFINGHELFWDNNPSKLEHYNYPTFKIFIIAHPSLIATNFQPLPIIDLLSNYDPLLDISLHLPPLLSLVSVSSQSSVQKYLFLWQKMLTNLPTKYYSKMSPKTIKSMVTYLKIQINEYRKFRLANGLYKQNTIPDKEKSNMFVSSIELKEKNKIVYQTLINMQDIEKEQDLQRRNIFKIYVAAFNHQTRAPTNMGQGQTTNLKQPTFNPSYLSIENIKAFVPQQNLTQAKYLQYTRNQNALLPVENFVCEQAIGNMIVQSFYCGLAHQNFSSIEKQSISQTLISILTSTETHSKNTTDLMNSTYDGNKIESNELFPQLPRTPNFSLTKYNYNVCKGWQQWHQQICMSLLPNQTNCTSSTTNQSLHPSEILRLNYQSFPAKEALKNYLSSLNISYKINPIQNYQNSEILWVIYLLIYNTNLTIINNSDWMFDQQISNLSLSPSHQHLTVSINLKEFSYQRWLQWMNINYLPLFQHQIIKINHQQMNYISKYSQIHYQRCWGVKKNIDTGMNTKYKRQWERNTNAKGLLHIESEQMGKWEGFGVRVIVGERELDVREEIKVYMKEVNIQRVYKILSHSNEKATKKTNQLQVKPEVTSQILTHLNKLIILCKVLRNKPLYSRIIKITLQQNTSHKHSLEEAQIGIHKYWNYFDLYGIEIHHNQEKLANILKVTEEMMKVERTLRAEILINGNDNQNDESNTSKLQIFLREFQSKIEGLLVEYIQECMLEIKFSQSTFLKYVPKYMLPKPKKYTPLVVQPNIDMRFDSHTFLYQEPIALKAITPVEESKDENQKYSVQDYQESHSYALLFGLNEQIIISEVGRQCKNMSVQNYMMGFLLYTKSKIFIQSQLQSGAMTKNLTEINSNLQSYLKSFSLLDPKVIKIVEKHHKNMHHPTIRVSYKKIYSCLHCNHPTQDIRLQQQLISIKQIDISGNIEVLYQNVNQQETNANFNNTLNTGRKEKIGTLGRRVSNLSELSLGSGSATGGNSENLMGVLNFVEIVGNRGIGKYVVEQIKNKISWKGNQFFVIFLHDKEAQDKQQQEHFWIRHIQPKQPVTQQKDPHSYNFLKTLQLRKAILDYQSHIINSHYISNGVLGRVYQPAITKKLQTMKDIISNSKIELEEKKETFIKCQSDIETSRKNVDEMSLKLQENIEKIDNLRIELRNVGKKIDVYAGQAELQQAKKQLLSLGIKTIQKQILKSQYLDDDSFCLSFVYRFNILADSTYFPSKNTTQSYQIYTLSSKILQQQKRTFIKFINSGRLGVMLENENYSPTDAQIQGLINTRSCFNYLASYEEHTEAKNSEGYCVRNIAEQQLSLIEQRQANSIIKLFHTYISYLSCHSIISYILQTTSLNLQKQLQQTEAQNANLTPQIASQKHQVISFEQKEVTYQFKYQKINEQVQIQEENLKFFAEVALKNLQIMKKIFEENFFEVENRKIEEVVEEICKVVVDLGEKCSECLKYGQEPSYLLSPSCLKYLLLIMLPAQTSLRSLYQSSPQQLVHNFLYNHLKLGYQIQTHDCGSISKQQYGICMDMRKLNIITHRKDREEMMNLDIGEMIARHLFDGRDLEIKEIKVHLDKLHKQIEMGLQKLIQKVDLVQIKDRSSLVSFEIMPSKIQQILHQFNQQNQKFHAKRYFVQWKQKNASKWNICLELAQILLNDSNWKPKAAMIEVHEQNKTKSRKIRYYAPIICRLLKSCCSQQQILGLSVTKMHSIIIKLLCQVLYDHSPLSIKSSMLSHLSLIHEDNITYEQKQFNPNFVKQMENVEIYNEVSLLQGLLLYGSSIVFVQDSPNARQTINQKAEKLGYDVILRVKNQGWNKSATQAIEKRKSNEEPSQNQSQQEQNNTVQCQYYQNLQSNNKKIIMNEIKYLDEERCQGLLKSLEELEHKIQESEQQYAKYIFVVGEEVSGLIQKNIQPVYRIFYQTCLLSKLANQTDLGKYKQQNHFTIQTQSQKQYEQLGIQMLAKAFQFYHHNFNALNMDLFTQPSFNSHQQSQNITDVPLILKVESDASQQQLKPKEQGFVPNHYLLKYSSIFLHLADINPFSKEYKMMKQLVNEMSNFDKVVEGYQIFELFHGIKKTGNQIGKLISLWGKQIKVETFLRAVLEFHVENGNQLEEQVLVSQIKNKYSGFIKFMQKIHQVFSSQKQIKYDWKFITNSYQDVELPIRPQFLHEEKLKQNKRKYERKSRDIEKQCIIRLFDFQRSKNKMKMNTDSLIGFANEMETYLADPKIYAILNKTVQAAINRIINAKVKRQQDQRKNSGKNKNFVATLDQAIAFIKMNEVQKLFRNSHTSQVLEFIQCVYSSITQRNVSNLFFEACEIEDNKKESSKLFAGYLEQQQLNKTLKITLTLTLHHVKLQKNQVSDKSHLLLEVSIAESNTDYKFLTLNHIPPLQQQFNQLRISNISHSSTSKTNELHQSHQLRDSYASNIHISDEENQLLLSTVTVEVKSKHKDLQIPIYDNGKFVGVFLINSKHVSEIQEIKSYGSF